MPSPPPTAPEYPKAPGRAHRPLRPDVYDAPGPPVVFSVAGWFHHFRTVHATQRSNSRFLALPWDTSTVNRMFNSIALPNKHREAVRFLLAGTFATALHYLLLIALVEISPLAPVTASLISYALAALANYLLNYYLTFSCQIAHQADRKSTRLNSSHVAISYAVFC